MWVRTAQQWPLTPSPPHLPLHFAMAMVVPLIVAVQKLNFTQTAHIEVVLPHLVVDGHKPAIGQICARCACSVIPSLFCLLATHLKQQGRIKIFIAVANSNLFA